MLNLRRSEFDSAVRAAGARSRREKQGDAEGACREADPKFTVVPKGGSTKVPDPKGAEAALREM